ncbi:MAG: helix-turn-helix domain-containing protein [Lachnospiraceae bacterium]|nr:helix-turn-helix domain-containing protein [Lachnospiraceae bacterium]
MEDIDVEIRNDETEAERLGRMIKYLRQLTGMKREDFANYLHIPLGTVRDWEQGKRKMPEYLYELIEYKVSRELLSVEKEKENEKNK